VKLLYALVRILVVVAFLIPMGAVAIPSAVGSVAPSLNFGPASCPGSSGPCPMGVADYGITPSDGKYSYTAVTFKSTVTFTKLDIGKSTVSTKYPEMSIQLNAVADNMYFKGHAGFYWTQDVPFVIQEGSNKFVVTAVDNIWNFETGASMKGVSGNHEGDCATSGVGSPGQYYCEAKNAYTVSLPFTVTMEMLVGISSGHSAVEFEFGVTGHAVVAYDLVTFPGSAPQYPFYLVEYASPPYSSVLLLDAETVLCGPGGGSSVKILAIAATFQEEYKASGGAKFTSIPHAWSEGHDTAETSSGVHMSHSGKTGVAKSGTDNSIALW
jgi:Thermopsin